MWQITLDGKTLRLDDLSPAVLQRVASAHDLSWVDVFASPMANLDAFVALVAECAKVLEVNAPDMATVGAIRAVGNDMLTRADENLPSEYEDGLPLAEGDPKTDT